MKALDIELAGKALTIACPEGQEQALLESADYLQQKIDEIGGKAPTAGLLKVVLMAGLNVSHELLEQKQLVGTTDNHIEQLSQMIEQSLQQAAQKL